MNPGKFIVLEALDGVGKTTLTAGLATTLPAVALAMPGLPRPVMHAVFTGLGPDPTARCLFHAAAARAIGLRARELAAGGQHVIVDRYWLSALAYARARGMAADFSAIEAQIPEPDLTVVLTLAEGERQRRLVQRGATEVDRETLSTAFQSAVFTEFGHQDRAKAWRPQLTFDVTGLTVAGALTKVLDALRGLGVGSGS